MVKAGKKGAKKRSTKKASKKQRRKTTVIERPSPNERTTQETADLLGLKHAASARWLHLHGFLEGRLVGRALWIDLDSIKRYKKERQPRGRPVDTITGESHNKRGERETVYQREYKRKMRAGLNTTSHKRRRAAAAKRG